MTTRIRPVLVSHFKCDTRTVPCHALSHPQAFASRVFMMSI